jgi:hypothetical protein
MMKASLAMATGFAGWKCDITSEIFEVQTG